MDLSILFPTKLHSFTATFLKDAHILDLSQAPLMLYQQKNSSETYNL